jgi:hypothetical protein
LRRGRRREERQRHVVLQGARVTRATPSLNDGFALYGAGDGDALLLPAGGSCLREEEGGLRPVSEAQPS